MRELLTPSCLIRFFVEFIYFPPSVASLINTQLIPVGSSVRNLSIGRGEPPRAISKISCSGTRGQPLLTQHLLQVFHPLPNLRLQLGQFSEDLLRRAMLHFFMNDLFVAIEAQIIALCS